MKNLAIILVIAVALTFTVGTIMIKKMKQRQLSKNFKLGEFMHTSAGFPNIPDKTQIENIDFIVQKILQPLRNHFGKPITVTSGFRSPEVNRSIGGAKYSQHKEGRAVDFKISGVDNKKIVETIRYLGLPFDQLIDEQLGGKKWIHVSLINGSGNRSQVLSARKVNGQTKYLPYG